MNAAEAKEIYLQSKGLLETSLTDAYKIIKERAELGFNDAWVTIPSEQLFDSFKLALSDKGYVLHNRQSFQLLISF